jgi:lipopolysaccharide biosynthesis protein
MTRLVAFYLPQFHRVAENDLWWGEGFTEWTLVRRARPRFHGHQQPRLAGELGFYDLTEEGISDQQAALARAYGVDAFCYYHYWFGGRRLLEQPVQRMLSTGSPDFPFLLCWANENWSRAFDGGTREVLVEQTYPPGDDLIHARALAPAMADPRAVRHDGRPVFAVYRAAQIPDPRRTTETWRAELTRLGLPDPYLLRVESFPDEDGDPRALGFDAAVEFAPRWRHVPRAGRTDRVRRGLVAAGLGPRRWANHVVDYREVARSQLASPDPGYPRMPCVTPAWDNTPRRPSGGLVLTDATPDNYQDWLRQAWGRASDAGLPFVFVNAWNEWSEGAHLEPDALIGRARLEATLRGRAGDA